jgi:type IV secretory pathway TraG/TraD family ATPase VirD4
VKTPTEAVPTGPEEARAAALAEVRSLARAGGWGIFLGNSPAGPVFASPQHCVLVLGPPRSGKTSSLVVPNVICAPGAVLVTSTKPDVLMATSPARRQLGRCLLFDPSGHLDPPAGVEPIAWSPLHGGDDFDEVLLRTKAMTAAARPGSDRDESAHWTERAGTVIACLLHAAALSGDRLATVISAVNRHDAGRALAVLDEHGSSVPFDSLSGVVATDSREQSGIWSTAASVLAAYQSRAALDSADGEALDADETVRSCDTVYVVAPSDSQRHAAPLVAGLVHDLRRAAYDAAARNAGHTGHSGARLTLVLDEVANIAPLHELPHLAAEGAGQGVLTLACLQDLSQARARWGPIAEGFLSLFGTKVVLPGIADVRTLQAISLLAGEHDVARWTVSRQQGGPRRARRAVGYSVALQRERLLEPSDVGRGRDGEAIVLVGTRPARVLLSPYYAGGPWRAACDIVEKQPATALPAYHGAHPGEEPAWRRDPVPAEVTGAASRRHARAGAGRDAGAAARRGLRGG